MTRFIKFAFLCTGVYKFWITGFKILWQMFLKRHEQAWKRWKRMDTTHMNFTADYTFRSKSWSKMRNFFFFLFGSALLGDTVKWKIKVVTLLMTLLTDTFDISDDLDIRFFVLENCHISCSKLLLKFSWNSSKMETFRKRT